MALLFTARRIRSGEVAADAAMRLTDNLARLGRHGHHDARYRPDDFAVASRHHLSRGIGGASLLLFLFVLLGWLPRAGGAAATFVVWEDELHVRLPPVQADFPGQRARYHEERAAYYQTHAGRTLEGAAQERYGNTSNDAIGNIYNNWRRQRVRERERAEDDNDRRVRQRRDDPAQQAAHREGSARAEQE